MTVANGWDTRSRKVMMEQQAKKDGLTCLRTMDDIQEAQDKRQRGQGQENILAPTRWKLRKAVKTVSPPLNTLELENTPIRQQEARRATARPGPYVMSAG